VDDDTLALAGMRGGLQGAASRWATYPLSARTPAGDAVRTGRPVVLNGREAITAAYPDLESAATGQRSIVCLPLRVVHRSIGAISLSFPGRGSLDAAELEFLGILADSCAQSLDRVQALADASDKTIQLSYLADASSELARSLDYQATLGKAARLAVPEFADWCSVALVEDGDLRTLSVAHVDPALVDAARDLQERYPPDREAGQGAWHVMRTGVSELLPEISDELLVAAAQDEEHLRLLRELDLRSALVVPLVARGEVLGVMSWVSGSRRRRYTEADLEFAEDLARRAAVAIDNAQLYSETLDAAVRLQRAVLPETLKAPEGWEVASLYSPAGRTEVGGDFYDVIALDDGRMLILVGDVMGRGVTAAAAMAQMRSAVRAYAAVEPAPATVMTKLDVMFAAYDIPQLVTLVYALADPARDTLEVANAGHPPPLLRRANGTVEQLAHASGPPLGVSGSVRTTMSLPLLQGDTLLAFTDGLIERRTEDIDRGLARLAGQGRLLGSDDLGGALEELVSSVRDHTRNDDVAAVAVRRRT
jgi:serine phosphatase RsbU (regulator of sigma subunit)